MQLRRLPPVRPSITPCTASSTIDKSNGANTGILVPIAALSEPSSFAPESSHDARTGRSPSVDVTGDSSYGMSLLQPQISPEQGRSRKMQTWTSSSGSPRTFGGKKKMPYRATSQNDENSARANLPLSIRRPLSPSSPQGVRRVRYAATSTVTPRCPSTLSRNMPPLSPSGSPRELFRRWRFRQLGSRCCSL